MPQKKIYFDENGSPTECVARIPSRLAACLYRARLDGGYTTETALVIEIIRQWAVERGLIGTVDLVKLAADLAAEEKGGDPPLPARGKRK